MSQFVGAASWAANDPRRRLAGVLVLAAENAAQVVQDTRKEARAVHNGLGQIHDGIRRILDLMSRLPRGGGNVEAREQTIEYLVTLLERLKTVVPEAQKGATRTQAYQAIMGELEAAEKRLRGESGQGGQGGQEGRKSTTGGRRKRRRKRGGFMYSPAARKASVARLKSRKASVRTHRRKRRKRTVRRRYKKSRRHQRRKRRRHGGRTRRRRR